MASAALTLHHLAELDLDIAHLLHPLLVLGSDESYPGLVEVSGVQLIHGPV